VQGKRVRNSMKRKRLIGENRKSSKKAELSGYGGVFPMGAGGWGGGESWRMILWILITVKVSVLLFYHSSVRLGSGVD
jgi:hypothetical protein